MQECPTLIQEYALIVEVGFDLRFRYPTIAQLKQIRTSSIEIGRRTKYRKLSRIWRGFRDCFSGSKIEGKFAWIVLPLEAQHLVV